MKYATIKHFGFIAADTDNFYQVTTEAPHKGFTYDPLLMNNGSVMLFEGTLRACKAYCKANGFTPIHDGYHKAERERQARKPQARKPQARKPQARKPQPQAQGSLF